MIEWWDEKMFFSFFLNSPTETGQTLARQKASGGSPTPVLVLPNQQRWYAKWKLSWNIYHILHQSEAF